MLSPRAGGRNSGTSLVPFLRPVAGESIPWVTVGALGLTQILAWGATYYLLAVLAEPEVYMAPMRAAFSVQIRA